MKRGAFSILGILLSLFLLVACSKEEAAPVNPRMAKSGQKLTNEPEIPVANDSSDSVAPENNEPVTATPTPGDAQSAASSSALGAPALNQTQMAQLIQLARNGNANAQVELGNAFFEGKGVPVNKKAAEYWWRQAAARRHPVAVQNLQMLNTKPEEGVSFFGTPSKGDRFVFIIDKSGSMYGDRLEMAKEAILQSLMQLQENGGKFYIYFFNRQSDAMPASAMLEATPDNILRMSEWLKSQKAQGGTDPSDSIKSAFSHKPTELFLLTDGAFRTRKDEPAVRDLLNSLNSDKAVKINTLGIGESLRGREGETVLMLIAKDNGGTYTFIDPSTNAPDPVVPAPPLPKK